MTDTTSNRIRLAPPVTGIMRAIRILVACYAGLSALTLVAAALLPVDLVPDSVWIRGGIVLLSSLLLSLFAARAARGSRAAWRRVCVLAAIMTVAVVVVVAIPGMLPDWMKLEQVACGALLFTVVVLGVSREVRTAFAAPAPVRG
jgi:hypothetical protein